MAGFSCFTQVSILKSEHYFCDMILRTDLPFENQPSRLKKTTRMDSLVNIDLVPLVSLKVYLKNLRLKIDYSVHKLQHFIGVIDAKSIIIHS